MNIAGKHALITGASKRIGRAIADRLLAEGANISAHYFTSEKTALEFQQSAAPRVQVFQADLRDTTAAAQLCQRAKRAFGPVDILVNSASVYYPTPADTCTESEWDDLMACNLKALFFLAQAVHAAQPDRGGVILNLVDVYAERALSGYAPYTATKAGLLQLTRSLAKEWAPAWRVNAVSPGPILFPEHYSDERKQKSIERTLLKRQGQPEDIAAACGFLIENEYMTGSNLAVDGGRHLCF